MLGDSNPFNETYLEYFVRDGIKYDSKVKDEKNKITIENESIPNGDNWEKITFKQN